MTSSGFDPRYPRMFQRGYVPPPRDPRIALTSPIDLAGLPSPRPRSRPRDPRVALMAPIPSVASRDAASAD
jgi:hypothetical protein